MGIFRIIYSEYGKILYSSGLNNGKFNVLLSFKGSRYHVCRGRMGFEILLSGVPDFFDRNKILSGGDLSHYQVPHCI